MEEKDRYSPQNGDHFIGTEMAMKDLNYMSIAEDAIKKIKKGAFFNCKSRKRAQHHDHWLGHFRIYLAKADHDGSGAIFEAYLWYYRRAEDFTVTVPAGDMGKETAFCGSKSGRDLDKFKMCNLEIFNGSRVASPIIKTPGYHYECKIVYKSAMNPAYLDKKYDSSLYPQKDYHTLYFGEIMACYET